MHLSLQSITPVMTTETDLHNTSATAETARVVLFTHRFVTKDGQTDGGMMTVVASNTVKECDRCSKVFTVADVSRDKDGGHAIKSAVVEKPITNIAMLGATEPELLTTEVSNAFDIWCLSFTHLPRDVVIHCTLCQKLESLGHIFLAESMGIALSTLTWWAVKPSVVGKNAEVQSKGP